MSQTFCAESPFQVGDAIKLEMIGIQFHNVETVDDKQIVSLSFHHPLFEKEEFCEYPSVHVSGVYHCSSNTNRARPLMVDEETQLPLVGTYKESTCLQYTWLTISYFILMLKLTTEDTNFLVKDKHTVLLHPPEGLLEKRVFIHDLFVGRDAIQFDSEKDRKQLIDWWNQLKLDLQSLRVRTLKDYLVCNKMFSFSTFSDLESWVRVYPEVLDLRIEKELALYLLCKHTVEVLKRKYKLIPQQVPLQNLLEE